MSFFILETCNRTVNRLDETWDYSDGSSNLVQNINIKLPVNTGSYPRRLIFINNAVNNCSHI